jgi:hypothetical protein
VNDNSFNLPRDLSAGDLPQVTLCQYNHQHHPPYRKVGLH